MAAGDQRDGFLVVHGHAGERHTHVATGGDRVGVAIRSFGVNVDQAHLHGGQRIVQIALAGVAAVRLVAGRQPFAFGAPENFLFGLPDIHTSAGEAEGLEPHRFECAVAGQDQEVGPGELVAVFLLDRPEQPTRFVEVDVVRPAVERRETLVAGAGAAAPVGDAVGTRAMPGHADHQATIVPPVGGPPGLAVGHEGLEVVLQGSHVQLLQLFTVVEAGTHGVGLGIVLVQDVQVQGLGPPLHGLAAGGGLGTVHDRALAGGLGLIRVVCHFFLLG
ncbi:hypothetical protein SDC9_166408 [bioreactor metagenome]|uniref:Uncharacterized protein n=1 Tax=bioreactor metagenome TaxID=1076179 RepID=A0A645FZC0_9ZZZZ